MNICRRKKLFAGLFLFTGLTPPGIALEPFKMAEAFETICDSCKSAAAMEAQEKTYQCLFCPEEIDSPRKKQGKNLAQTASTNDLYNFYKKCNNRPNSSDSPGNSEGTGSSSSGTSMPSDSVGSSGSTENPGTSNGAQGSSCGGCGMLAPLGVQLSEVRAAVRELQKLAYALETDVSYCKKQCNTNSGLESKVTSNKNKIIEMFINLEELGEQVASIREDTNRSLSSALDQIQADQKEMQESLNDYKETLSNQVNNDLKEAFNKQQEDFFNQISYCEDLVDRIRQILGAGPNFDSLDDNNLGRALKDIELIKEGLKNHDERIGNLDSLELRDLAFKIDSHFPPTTASVQIYLQSIIRDLLNFKESFKDRTTEAVSETVEELKQEILENKEALNPLLEQVPYLMELLDTLTHEELLQLKNLESLIADSAADYINSPAFSLSLNEKYKTIVEFLLQQDLTIVQNDISSLQNEVLRLKELCSNLEEGDDGLGSLESALSALDRKIDDLEEALTKKQEQLSANVDQKISDLEKKLTAACSKNIDQLSESLTSKVDGIEQGLTSKIDGVEQGLTSKVEGVEQGLTSKVDRMEEGILSQMDEVEQGLSSKIDEVEQGVSSKIDEVEQGLTSRIDGIEQRIDNLESDIETMETDLTESIGHNTAAIKTFQDSVDDLSGRFDGFDETANTLKDGFEEVKKGYDSLDKRMEAWGANADVQKFEELKQALDSRMEAVEKNDSEIQGKFKAIDLAIEELQGLIDQDAVDGLSADVQRLFEEVADLTEDLAEKADREELESKADKIDLNQKADKSEVQVVDTKLEEHIQSSEECEEKLSQEIVTLKEQLNALQEDFYGSEEDNENKGNSSGSGDQDNGNKGEDNNTKDLLDSLGQRVTTLEEQVAVLDVDKLLELIKTLEDQNDILQDPASFIEGLNQKIQELEAKLNSAETELNATESRLSTTESQLNAVQIKHEADLNNLKAEFDARLKTLEEKIEEIGGPEPDVSDTSSSRN